MDGEKRGDNNLECWLKIWHWVAIALGCAWIVFGHTRHYILGGMPDVSFVRIAFDSLLSASCVVPISFLPFQIISEKIWSLKRGDNRWGVRFWIAIHVAAVLLFSFLLAQKPIGKSEKFSDAPSSDAFDCDPW